MRNSIAVLALVAVCLLGASPVHAQGGPQGTVGQSAGTGSWKVTFPADAQVAPRDVFNVVRDGSVVGQAMVLIVKNQGMVAVQMQGTLQPGDQLAFVRHDSVPTTP